MRVPTAPHRRPAARKPRTVLVLALGLLLALLPAGTSMAIPVPPGSPAPIEVERQGYGAAGEPMFWARVGSTGGEVRWKVCAPECGDVVASGPIFRPASLPVGSTVEASIEVGGDMLTGRSPAWPGAPLATALPRVQGELRVGRVVGSAPGTWAGGWQDDGSYFTYRLCRTATGEDCRWFRAATFERDQVTVDPAWVGWYLGAVEHRYGAGAAFPAIAYMGPAWGVVPDHSQSIPSGPLTAVGPLAGPIPASTPGALPTVRGALRAGRTVEPRSGSWPDRPADGVIWTGLRACPARQDSDRCVALTDFARAPGRPATAEASRPALDAPVPLDSRYLGWYVGAVSLHLRTGHGWGPATSPRESVPSPSPVVVHGPLSRKPVRLGFTPRATIRSRAITHPTRRTTLATVRCQDRCVARVAVVSGRRTTKLRLTVAKGKATRLTVPARATRGQRARVTIRFDHHPRVVRRTVQLV